MEIDRRTWIVHYIHFGVKHFSGAKLEGSPIKFPLGCIPELPTTNNDPDSNSDGWYGGALWGWFDHLKGRHGEGDEVVYPAVLVEGETMMRLCLLASESTDDAEVVFDMKL